MSIDKLNPGAEFVGSLATMTRDILELGVKGALLGGIASGAYRIREEISNVSNSIFSSLGDIVADTFKGTLKGGASGLQIGATLAGIGLVVSTAISTSASIKAAFNKA